MGAQADGRAQACDVFVSYASADRPAVAALVDTIKQVTGGKVSVWWDHERIDTFDGITSRLEEGIAGARLVVACLSTTYPSRPACQWEALQVVRNFKRAIGGLCRQFHGAARLAGRREPL